MNVTSCFIVFTVTDDANNKEMRFSYPPTQTSDDTKGSNVSLSLSLYTKVLFYNFRQKQNCSEWTGSPRSSRLQAIRFRGWWRLTSYKFVR